MKELLKRLGNDLSQQLETFRFHPSQQRLVKPIYEGWQAIALELLPTSDTRRLKVAAYAQVRLDPLENIYGPHHIYLSKREAKTHPTLTFNIDNLLSDSPLVHSFVNTEHGLAEFTVAYAEALRENVIPWLERYSSEDALVAGFQDVDPQQWLVSDRSVRSAVLLSIYAKRGDWINFDAAADAFVTFCETPHGKVYSAMANSIINGIRQSFA